MFCHVLRWQGRPFSSFLSCAGIATIRFSHIGGIITDEKAENLGGVITDEKAEKRSLTQVRCAE